MTGDDAAADVVVVGAGLAGLVAARSLAATRRVLVLDKGRGVGGRLATRRIGAAVLDHGAQFFTVRDPAFGALVAGWEAAGVAVPWFERLAGEGGGAPAHVRYRGAPTMTALAKDLARGLDVRSATTVERIALREGRWHLAIADGSEVAAAALVITSPVPQALALLDAGGVTLDASDRSALGAIAYDPCLALLAPLSGPSGLAAPGAIRPAHPDLDWVADNHVKGTSPLPAVTIHASAAWSRSHWDDADDAIAVDLLAAAALGSAPVPGTSQVVRWRYAKPSTPHPERALRASGVPPLVFAGDAFGGARVEGAALSGMAAAEALHGGERAV